MTVRQNRVSCHTISNLLYFTHFDPPPPLLTARSNHIYLYIQIHMNRCSGEREGKPNNIQRCILWWFRQKERIWILTDRARMEINHSIYFFCKIVNRKRHLDQVRHWDVTPPTTAKPQRRERTRKKKDPNPLFSTATERVVYY